MSKAIILTLILMLSFTKCACAATLSVFSGDAQAFTLPTKCNFRLDGEIRTGDLANVASAREQVQKLISERLAINWSITAQWASQSPVLCLNSPGGNFIEGLRIAEYFMTVAADHEVTTYVEDKAECYSACALIFLAGRLNDRGGETYPARFLNVGGRLGFHAPYINPTTLEDRPYSRTDVAVIYKAAISGVTAAIQLFDGRASGGPKVNEDNRPWVSSSLFIEMLRKNPDELLSIDTIGKAGRWGIGLVGVKEINTLTKSALRQACDNISAWKNDQEGSATPIYEPLSPSDPDFRYFNRMQGASVFSIKGVRHTYFCLAKPLLGQPDSSGKQGKLDGVMVKLLQDTLDLRAGATTFYGYEAPLWAAAFSPDTPLIALGACPSNSGFCWPRKRESDSLPPHEQDIPRLEDR